MPSRSLPSDLGRPRANAQPPAQASAPASLEMPARSQPRTSPSGRRAPARRAHRHHPRVLAALCYAVPIVPGWWQLVHERRNPFLRFHAAQSLVFFALVAAGQIGFYALLVLAGGLITSDRLAIAAAFTFVALYLAFAVCVTIVWLRLLASCIRGDARPLPLAGRLALRLERFAPRAAWRRWWSG
jgi:uncharacterized membrane protein